MRAIVAPSTGAVSRADAPTISVLVTAYRAAPHEIIVCHDGTTDAVDGAPAAFRERIRLIRKANGRGAPARRWIASLGG
jgi:hypothetical protein